MKIATIALLSLLAFDVFASSGEKVMVSVPCDHLSRDDCDKYTQVFRTLGIYLFGGESGFDLETFRGSGCAGHTYSAHHACFSAFLFKGRSADEQAALVPQGNTAVVYFLVDPMRMSDQSIWGTWWLFTKRGSSARSTFVLRRLDRDSSPWLLIDVASLPHTLNQFEVTEDVKPRGGFLTSKTSRLFGHLAIPAP